MRFAERLLWRVVGVGAAVMIAALAPTRPAAAHASLLSAVPAEGITVPEPPKTFRLDFNEPVSPLVLRLIRPSGQVVSLTEVSAADTHVTVTAPAMPDQGSYILSWRVISADGHPVGGVVSFAVGHASTGAPVLPATDATPVHIAIWVAQWLLALGLFVGIGGAAFEAWLAAKRPMPQRRLFAAVMACGLAAALISLPLQGLDALAETAWDWWRPAVWSEGFLRTSWGSTVVLAAATLGLGLAALRLQARSAARSLALAAVAGVGLALVASGHATTVAPRLLTVPAVFLHGIGVAFWVGSLLPLAIAVNGGDRVALERFSWTIPVPLGILVATGVVLAAVQLDRPDALWTTAYGLALSGKIGLVLLMLALAAVNRYALVPRLALAGSRRLVAVIAAEFVLAVAILGIVGLWRFTPPPRALAAAETSYIHFHGDRAMAQIDVTPQRDRGAGVSIAVTDPDFNPVAAKEVTLVIWNPTAGIEPIRSSAAFEGGAQWRITGLRIPLAGVWRMRLEILINDFEKVMLEDYVELPRAP